MIRCGWNSGATTDVDSPVWEICERAAEVQALVHDHIECGRHSAADVVAKAQAVLSEPVPLRGDVSDRLSRRKRRRRVMDSVL